MLSYLHWCILHQQPSSHPSDVLPNVYQIVCPSHPHTNCHTRHRGLHEYIGLSGSALSWAKSYLSNRSQRVLIGNFMSEPVSLNFGLPQVSVLGPQWLTIYTYPIENIVRRHNLSFHLYADDTQIYFAFKPHYSRQNILRIQSCIEDIRLWMRDNFLKLSDSKTEFLVIGSKHQKSQN